MLSGIEAGYLLAILMAIYARAIGQERSGTQRAYFRQWKRCESVRWSRRLVTRVA